MSDKRELLLAICEQPGWIPDPDAALVDHLLAELQQEGWIFIRLDGWEATPKALDRYPDFAGQDDIADPDGSVERVAEHRTVPRDRVVRLIETLLYQLPFTRVHTLVETSRIDARPGINETVYQLANEMVQRMCE
jgi:hypothetical protein